MKSIKKFKESEKEKEIEEVELKEGIPKKRKKADEGAELYDADMDDLDSSDIGEDEKKSLKLKNSSKVLRRKLS